MYSPASGLYSCPLAMTDGSAKTIQSLGLQLPEAWHHLTSRSPAEFWTAGFVFPRFPEILRICETLFLQCIIWDVTVLKSTKIPVNPAHSVRLLALSSFSTAVPQVSG
jgi:hypothetical protein